MSAFTYTAQWIGGPHDGEHIEVQRTQTEHTQTFNVETPTGTQKTTITFPITKNEYGERTINWTPQHSQQL